MGLFAGLLVLAITMACSAAFVMPRVHVRPLASARLAAPSDGNTIDSTRVVRMGGGTEMMVAKRRRRSLEEASPETEAQTTTRVVEQNAPAVSSLALQQRQLFQLLPSNSNLATFSHSRTNSSNGSGLRKITQCLLLWARS